MFNQTVFEQKVYDFVTQKVNDEFSGLLKKGMSQQEGLRIQRQVMQALNSVTEETITQISYGLLIRNMDK